LVVKDQSNGESSNTIATPETNTPNFNINPNQNQVPLIYISQNIYMEL